MKRIKLNDFLETIFFGITVLIIVQCVSMFICQRTVVVGASMETNFYDGDQLITDKLSYQFTDPERFDVIVFPYYYADGVNYIKRIIALPGETILINNDGEIYIDGELLEEEYGKETLIYPGIAENGLELGEDEYFVMGDNRNHSTDSRDIRVRVINKEDIIGKVVLRMFPNFTIY